MRPRQDVALVPGRVYRTRDFAAVSTNPTRTAASLVCAGALRKLAPGLFYAPKVGRFGAVPPDDQSVLEKLLNGTPFLLTGAERWNALGLGATAHFAAQLVYNTQRTGTVSLGSRKYLLRRVKFPENPTAEWFVVDLLNNRKVAGVDRAALEAGLRRALERHQLDAEALSRFGSLYGNPEAKEIVSKAVRAG